MAGGSCTDAPNPKAQGLRSEPYTPRPKLSSVKPKACMVGMAAGSCKNAGHLADYAQANMPAPRVSAMALQAPAGVGRRPQQRSRAYSEEDVRQERHWCECRLHRHLLGPLTFLHGSFADVSAGRCFRCRPGRALSLWGRQDWHLCGAAAPLWRLTRCAKFPLGPWSSGSRSGRACIGCQPRWGRQFRHAGTGSSGLEERRLRGECARRHRELGSAPTCPAVIDTPARGQKPLDVLISTAVCTHLRCLLRM